VSSVVSVVPQRRRNRQFVALQVAPKTRPQALRDLYRDFATVNRDADQESATTQTVQSTSATSR
jgi:hypothetical protein